MAEIPWWAHSPSPMTLGIYSILAIYGAYKLESKTPRQWLHNFCEAGFVIGLIILPFDVAWQTFQCLKFYSLGLLYLEGMKVVLSTFIRDAAIYALCFVSSYKLADKTRKLDLNKSWLVLIPIITLGITFLFSPDPGWTDWTYAFRWPELSSATWLIAYLTDIPVRVMTGLAVVGLWKDNFLAKK